MCNLCILIWIIVENCLIDLCSRNTWLWRESVAFHEVKPSVDYTRPNAKGVQIQIQNSIRAYSLLLGKMSTYELYKYEWISYGYFTAENIGYGSHQSQQSFGSGAMLGQFWPTTGPVQSQNQMFIGIWAPQCICLVGVDNYTGYHFASMISVKVKNCIYFLIGESAPE